MKIAKSLCPSCRSLVVLFTFGNQKVLEIHIDLPIKGVFESILWTLSSTDNGWK